MLYYTCIVNVCSSASILTMVLYGWQQKVVRFAEHGNIKLTGDLKTFRLSLSL